MVTKWLLIALPLVLIAALAQSALWVPGYESQAKSNPERLRTFLRADIGDAKGLNPMIGADANASEVMDGIFEGLVDTDENLRLIGRLADHWRVTEDAYLAVLPDRQLLDGSAATGPRLLSLIEAARRDKQLEGLEASIEGVQLVPGETRRASETVLVDNAKGKQAPLDVEMSIDVPPRIELRLSKVEPRLFERLERLLGHAYFQNYPFADRFKLKNPAQMSALRDRLPELLGIGEHNPIITFFLHSGVRWHDGQSLTADDVKFTYEAIVDPKNASPRASSFEPIKSVEVLDPLTARVTYKRLYAPGIIKWTMGIIPKHLLDAAALEREATRRGLSREARAAISIRNSEFNRRPVGSGPFRFAEWRPDQFIHLTRYDGYWDHGANFHLPEYRDLYFRAIPDFLTMELEFNAGALDRYQALPHQAQRYRNDPEYHVVARRRGRYDYIAYNLRRPLFQDLRVRRALGMAIDVDSLIKYALSGEGKRATGPYYSNTPFADPDLKPLPYDPAGALKLLAEAGWHKNTRGVLEKEGKPFRFTLVTNNANPQRKAIMIIAQDAWRQIGIDCKIQAFEWTVFLEDTMHALNFDAVVLAWAGGDVDPDKFQLWHSSQAGPYQLNYAGYSNPRVDHLIERIRDEYDFDAQIELTREMDRLVAEDQPYTFLYEPIEPVVLDKRIVRVRRKPDGTEFYTRIEPSATGRIDTYFDDWRKLAAEPVYAAE